MMTRRGFAGLLFGCAAALLLGGCGLGGPDATFRYKMVVEVETPEGVRSGTSVRELRFFDAGGSPSIGQSRPQVKLVGEAIAIDLPSGKTLFALLTGDDGDVDYAARIADRTELWNVKKPVPRNGTVGLWPDAPDTVGLVMGSPLPMLVMFKDVTDPTSVVGVDPANLAASFGAGYRLKAISIHATDEPVTTGIEKRLGWLDDPKVMENPGWAKLPIETRHAINGLISGKRNAK